MKAVPPLWKEEKPALYELGAFKANYYLEKVREVVQEWMRVGSAAFLPKFLISFSKRKFLMVKTSGLQWALLQCWVPHDVNDSTGELN